MRSFARLNSAFGRWAGDAFVGCRTGGTTPTAATWTRWCATSSALPTGCVRRDSASLHRTVALHARLALEQALDELRRRREPGLDHCPMRAQLLCVSSYVDAEVAREAAGAWGALSRAAHHHAYELAPTATELRGWLESVRRVVAVLSHVSAPATAPGT